MKKIRFILAGCLACFLFLPFDVAYAKIGTQTLIPDTVADPHSKYTAKYESGTRQHCTAILIASNVAVTAQHCGGAQRTKSGGRIYPGESGLRTPFGYMNISDYIPNPKYDIALLKGTERDQSKSYKYYIRKFKTSVTGYTDDELKDFMGKDAYSYGYPYKYSGYKQYRSDGKITLFERIPRPTLRTTLPASAGQSGSGVFLKDGEFVGIMITQTDDQGNVLPFTEDIAQWINENAK